MKLTAERVEHDNANTRTGTPAKCVETDSPCRRQDDEACEAVCRPRVAAFSAMGPEPIGDDEPASVDADPNAEAVGHADRRVWSVVRVRLGEPLMQPSLVVAGGYCLRL
jgi:hypothetical protein